MVMIFFAFTVKDDDVIPPPDYCFLYNCDPGVCVNDPDVGPYCNCTGTDTIQSGGAGRCSKWRRIVHN